MTCGQILRWNRRLHAVHGQQHDHVCHLEPGHPVSTGSGVQVHECGSCTIAWESDRRPHCWCGPNQTHPQCPRHSTHTRS
jgi:ABC-type ATPase with predicted acetyltransferase domain